MRPLLLAALLAGGARAADAPGKYELCQGNPELDRAVFVVVLTPKGGGAAKKWSFVLDHCALSGRDKSHPMEVQRLYEGGNGQGFGLTTQMGSLISSARLYPSRLRTAAGSLTAELGPFFTSDLLSGAAVDAGRALKATVTIQARKPSEP